MSLKNQPIYKDIVLKENLNGKYSWGGTSFNSALSEAIDLLKEFENNYLVLIFLSDGEDRASQSTLEKLRKVTEDLDCMSFIIGIGEDNAELRQIAKFSNQGEYQSVKESFRLKDYIFNLLKKVIDSIGYGNSGFYFGDKK